MGNVHHQVERTGQVDVHDVDVAHAGGLLVLVDDGVAHRQVARQHVAHLEDPRGTGVGQYGGGQRHLDRPLVEPRVVVGVAQL
jgi:hypothetical protein